MIGTVVNDLIDNTQRNLAESKVQSIDDVREAGRPLVVMSDAVAAEHRALKRFLNRHLYRHEKKLEDARRAQQTLRDLFDAYLADASRMPAEFAAKAAATDEAGRARVVADYIAGMTDRFAIAEHRRLKGG